MLLFNLKLRHHSAIIKILKVEVKDMPDYTECDTCMNFEYDEEFDEYSCGVYLDEDELAHFLTSDYKKCPYYRPGDEYTIVKHQM